MKPILPSLLRSVRRRSLEVDEATPESELEVEHKEPEADGMEEQMGFSALGLPIPSPSPSELFV